MMEALQPGELDWYFSRLLSNYFKNKNVVGCNVQGVGVPTARRFLYGIRDTGTAMTHLLRIGFGVVLVCGLLGNAGAANAQEQGAIAGTIRAAETGEVLPGANVVMVGEQRGASTGADGAFRVEGLDPGQYGFGSRSPGMSSRRDR